MSSSTQPPYVIPVGASLGEVVTACQQGKLDQTILVEWCLSTPINLADSHVLLGVIDAATFGEIMSKQQSLLAGVKSKATPSRKTECQISKAAFFVHATQFDTAKLAIDVMPKAFSTGSFGFYGNGKMQIVVDGKPLTLQCSVNLTVIGSKESPAE